MDQVRWLLIAAGVVLVGCTGAAVDVSLESEEVGGRGQAIVGGTLDTGDPAVVSLTEHGSPFCTGTLIGPHTVLTAGHCIESTVPTAVHIGTYAYQPVQIVPVASAVVNPNYQGRIGIGQDIALVRLATGVTGIPAIPLNETALTNADIGKPLRHVGFGVTSMANHSSSGTKYQVSVPIRALQNGEVESGAPGQTPCSGDSGGPGFFTGTDGVERVAGVVSYGDAYCSGQSGWDTRVDRHVAWIRGTSADWEEATCAAGDRCKTDCPTVDWDCLCGKDGMCSKAQCPDLSQDPDCIDCGANGICSQATCPSVDPDCVCAQDNVCNPQCPSPNVDPDCKDCRANAICSVASCPSPDPDCAVEFGSCTAALQCQSRLCVTDVQHAYYCSRKCSRTGDCPADMTCSPSGACTYIPKFEAKLGERCDDTTPCSQGVCAITGVSAPTCFPACTASGGCADSTFECVSDLQGTPYCKAAPTETLQEAPAAPEEGVARENLTGCSASGRSPWEALAFLCVLGALGRRTRFPCRPAATPMFSTHRLLAALLACLFGLSAFGSANDKAKKVAKTKAPVAAKASPSTTVDVFKEKKTSDGAFGAREEIYEGLADVPQCRTATAPSNEKLWTEYRRLTGLTTAQGMPEKMVDAMVADTRNELKDVDPRLVCRKLTKDNETSQQELNLRGNLQRKVEEDQKKAQELSQ